MHIVVDPFTQLAMISCNCKKIINALTNYSLRCSSSIDIPANESISFFLAREREDEKEIIIKKRSRGRQASNLMS